MRIENIPFVILLALLVTSCNDNPDPTKDETTTVNGTVVEYGTNKPVEGAVVKMYSSSLRRMRSA